jgi:hypothetical protein
VFRLSADPIAASPLAYARLTRRFAALPGSIMILFFIIWPDFTPVPPKRSLPSNENAIFIPETTDFFLF